MTTREAIESPLPQGENEKLAYSFNFTPWSVTTISGTPVVVVKNLTTGLDVTATALPVNTPVAVGALVTTSKVQALVAGHIYRLECKIVASDGQEPEAFCILNGEV